MNQPEIHWQQRFSNYRKALQQLGNAVELGCQRPLSKIEQLGAIHVFENTYELACKMLRNFLITQGKTHIHGPREAIRNAFEEGLVNDIVGWMDMFEDSGKVLHAYHEEIAEEIAANIFSRHYLLLSVLKQRMESVI